jgi:hypothetical protein
MDSISLFWNMNVDTLRMPIVHLWIPHQLLKMGHRRQPTENTADERTTLAHQRPTTLSMLLGPDVSAVATAGSKGGEARHRRPWQRWRSWAPTSVLAASGANNWGRRCAWLAISRRSEPKPSRMQLRQRSSVR